MRTGWGWGAAIALALAAAPPLAAAHDLKCDKTVRFAPVDGVDAAVDGLGQKILEVRQYPVTLEYTWTVTNLHPWATSIAEWEKDSLLFPYHVLGVAVTDDTPYVGHELLTIESYQDCLERAGGGPIIGIALQPLLPPPEIVRLDNRYSVGFDYGEAQCTARVLCYPPENGEEGATRTMGFFKTHLDAVTECLDGTEEAVDPIDLGFMQISGDLATAEGEFLGLLWTSPSAYSDLDKARFLAARQLEVAICNTRLFGTDAATLISGAQTALAGTNCGAILDFASLLDTFNNSGDSVPFPSGFVPDPATPAEAEALAEFVTFPGGTCNP